MLMPRCGSSVELLFGIWCVRIIDIVVIIIIVVLIVSTTSSSGGRDIAVAGQWCCGGDGKGSDTVMQLIPQPPRDVCAISTR